MEPQMNTDAPHAANQPLDLLAVAAKNVGVQTHVGDADKRR